jgi:hypothetical protein
MLHHTQKKAAIKKMKEADPNISDAAIEASLELMDKMSTGTQPELPKEEFKTVMKKYDMWRGQLVMIKDRKVPGTGGRESTHMQFRITASKPKKTGIPLPLSGPHAAEYQNMTRFTIQQQETDMLFIEGTKGIIDFKLNDDTEKWDMTIRELETA